MVNRKKPGEEKARCGITFKLNLDIPFSISCVDSVAYKFEVACGNRNEKMSEVIREFVFKHLEVNPKNKKEFDILMEKVVEQAREVIYNKMKVSRNNKFSQMLQKDIDDYIKENKI